MVSDGSITAVVSIPGREGTISRKWSAGGSRVALPSVATVEDVGAWVALAVTGGIYGAYGAEQQFFGLT